MTAFAALRRGIAVPHLLALVAALVAAPAVIAQQQGPVTLRLNGNRGDANTYRFEQDISLRMPPELGGATEVKSLLVLSQTLQGTRGDTLRYEAQVRDVAVEMEPSPTGEDLDFSQFKGQRFTVVTDRRGDILAISGAAGPGAEQLQQSIRQVGFPTLPRGPVRVGDTWTDTTRIDASAMALPAEGEIVSVNRATLKGLSRSGAATVADLTVETTFHFEPGARAMPGMSVQMRGSRADNVRFDVTNGRYMSAAGQQDFTLNMSIPGAAGSLSIQGTARSRARLLDS